MDTSIKSIIKEMDKPLTEKIINASDQVSIDFKHNETAIDDVTSHLTKEQQKLWRKEIEQAYISGGNTGVELARDSRYKENLAVKEVNLKYRKENKP